MSNRAVVAVGLLLLTATPAFGQGNDLAEPAPDPAQPRPDVEVGLGLRAVTSLNGNLTGSGATSTAIDFSDTYLYVRPRLALRWFGLRAGALVSATFPDAYVDPGTPLVADANLFIENKWFTLRIGRGRLMSRIVPLPTLRDDDLIRYSEAQDPFSDGRSTADHQIGNTFDLSLWPSPRCFVDLHAENLSSFVLSPQDYSSFSINSIGATLGYKQIPALAPISLLRQVGMGANAYHVKDPSQAWLIDVMAGVWLNLLPDPVHRIDWRAQALYSPGVSGARPDTATGSFRAQVVSAASSLGYTFREEMNPTFRAAIVAGYKRYVSSGGDQYSVVANAFFALGVSTEIGLQYQYQQNSPEVAKLYGENLQHTLKLVLAGSFETVVNPRFDERDSILNTEGGYLP
jgi:hypothetical protein